MRLVAVWWLDANRIHDWVPIGEATALGAAPCVSVGMVVRDDESVIVLAQSVGATTVDEPADAVFHTVAIPRGCVTGVVELRNHLVP